MKATTIKDVATKAGVSIATVSYVLNGSRKVSAATSQKVLDAAASLGYTPNTLARALVGKQTKTIAVAMAQNFSEVSSDTGLAAVLQGIGEATYRADYGVILIFPDEITPALIGELVGKGVEGLLIIGFPAATSVKEAPFPIIPGGLIYSEISSLAQTGVWFSYRDVFTLAIKHLAELGCKRVCLLGPAFLDLTSLLCGLTAEQNGITIQHLIADPTGAGGYMAADNLAGTNGFDGIITFNDSMAIGALHALARKGVKVPEEIAVIGCTDAPAATYSEPPLTTVRLPWPALGKAMVERFLGTDSSNRIQPKLVIRESCGSALWI